MNFKFKAQGFRFKVQGLRLKFLALLFTFYFLLFTFACSIPNLENPECTEARNEVKKLYSYHFGNDMKPTAENLKLREKFLTPELAQELQKQTEAKKDYFTQTDDYPKAFRSGECAVVEVGKKVKLQVVLFWRDDTRSEQKEINIEVIKQNGIWLVNKVENKN